MDEETEVMIRETNEGRGEGRRREGAEESHKERNSEEDEEEEERDSWSSGSSGKRRIEEEEGFSRGISYISSFNRDHTLGINTSHPRQLTHGFSSSSCSSSSVSGSPLPYSRFPLFTRSLSRSGQGRREVGNEEEESNERRDRDHHGAMTQRLISPSSSSTSLFHPSIPTSLPWKADFNEKEDEEGDLNEDRLGPVDQSIQAACTSVSQQEKNPYRSFLDKETGRMASLSSTGKKEEEPLHVTKVSEECERSGSTLSSSLLSEEKQVRQKEEVREGRYSMEGEKVSSSAGRLSSSSSFPAFVSCRVDKVDEEIALSKTSKETADTKNRFVAPDINGEEKEEDKRRRRTHTSSSGCDSSSSPLCPPSLPSSSSSSLCHPSSSSSPLIFSVSISTPPDITRSPLSSPRSLAPSSYSCSSSSPLSPSSPFSSPPPPSSRHVRSPPSQPDEKKKKTEMPRVSYSSSSSHRDALQEKFAFRCGSPVNFTSEGKSFPVCFSARGDRKEDVGEEEKAFFFLHDGDIEQGLPKDMGPLMNNSLASSSSPPPSRDFSHQLSEILISGRVEDGEDEEEELVSHHDQDFLSEKRIVRNEEEKDVGRQEELKMEKKSMSSLAYLPWKRETETTSPSGEESDDEVGEDHEKMRRTLSIRKKKKKGDEEERERRGEGLLSLISSSASSESAPSTSSASVSTTTSWSSSFSSPPPSSPCFSSSSSYLSTTSSPPSLVDDDTEHSPSISSSHLLRHSPSLHGEVQKEEEREKDMTHDSASAPTSQPSVRLFHMKKRRSSGLQTSSLSSSSCSSSSCIKLSDGDACHLKSRWKKGPSRKTIVKNITPSDGSLKHPSDLLLSSSQKLLHLHPSSSPPPSFSFSFSSSSSHYSPSPFEKIMINREKIRKERETKDSLLRVALRIQQDGVVKSIVRRRLLQRYTLLLKQSEVFKEKVRKYQDQADPLRESLVQFLSIGSKLRSLQQSECWRKYIGPAIHDFDEELVAFMDDFDKSKTDSTCFDFSEEEILKVLGDEHHTAEEEEEDEEEEEEEDSHRGMDDIFYDEKGRRRSLSDEEEEESKRLGRSSLSPCSFSSSPLFRCCWRSLRALASKAAPSFMSRYFLSPSYSRKRRDEKKKFVYEREKDHDDGETMQVMAEETHAGKKRRPVGSERATVHQDSSQRCYASLLIGGKKIRKRQMKKGTSPFRKICFSAFLLFLLLLCCFILWTRYSIHR
ncbi:transmembrane protein [Cystoisospora suis]|uniref:Transmembrane protein n=1 Tax=Cystoisospora suis TaxID=483139 RepID=A0A2C6L7K2_9APIC|nr:transmembrane protein [Cystoisospora suis]